MAGKDPTGDKVSTSAERVAELFDEMGSTPNVDTLKTITEEMEKASQEDQPKTFRSAMIGVTNLHNRNESNWEMEGLGQCREIARNIIGEIGDSCGGASPEDMLIMLDTLIIYKSSSMYDKYKKSGGMTDNVLSLIINNFRLYEGNDIVAYVENKIGKPNVKEDMIMLLENVSGDDFKRFIRGLLLAGTETSEKAYEEIVSELPDMKNFYEKNAKFAQEVGLNIVNSLNGNSWMDDETHAFLNRYVENFGKYMKLDPDGWSRVIDAFKNKGLLQYKLNTDKLEEVIIG